MSLNPLLLQFNMGNASNLSVAPFLSLEQASWTPHIIIFGLLSYTILCWLLRFQRRDAKLKKYGFVDRKSLARMTNVEAQEITNYMAELEFPKIYYTSIQ